MWELDYTGSWARKNWCFWTVLLEQTLESPWTARRSNQSILKEFSPGCSLEGLMLKLKLPTLWLPDAKSWLIGKDPDAGKDWGQEEKGTTEDEMVGWHHRLDGHGFGWMPGVGDGQGGLACCGSWGRKESDTTVRLNWTDITNSDVIHLSGNRCKLPEGVRLGEGLQILGGMNVSLQDHSKQISRVIDHSVPWFTFEEPLCQD